MKIAGVVNNYAEALEIEEIVKVFIIEDRIFNLPSLKNKQNIKISKSLDIEKFPIKKLEYSEISHDKNPKIKSDEDFGHVFNVRGLN